MVAIWSNSIKPAGNGVYMITDDGEGDLDGRLDTETLTTSKKKGWKYEHV